MKQIFISTLLILMVCLTAPFAFAHTFPEHSSPGAGDTLSKPPPRVRILFDAKLEPAFSHLTVKNANGRVVSRKSRVAHDNAKLLEAVLSPLKPGTYHVYWRVVALDTHHTEGDYTFTVQR